MNDEGRTAMTFRSSFVLCLVLAACSKPAARDGDVKIQSEDRPENRTGTIGPLSSGIAHPPAEQLSDAHCAKDADCTVKDVGGCCGYTPRCLNVGAKTDPDAAREACAKEGRMATCGFVEITGCACVAGACTARTSAPVVQ